MSNYRVNYILDIMECNYIEAGSRGSWRMDLPNDCSEYVKLIRYLAAAMRPVAVSSAATCDHY